MSKLDDHPPHWDVFLAHAGADTPTAIELHRRLTDQGHRVFLDRLCLKAGVLWDVELPKAQRASTITVVLVSKQTEAAWYEKEEIASAIALAREEEGKHRVVPVYLQLDEAPTTVPYGLRRLHGIFMHGVEELDEVASGIAAVLAP